MILELTRRLAAQHSPLVLPRIADRALSTGMTVVCLRKPDITVDVNHHEQTFFTATNYVGIVVSLSLTSLTKGT
jgi:hypothetical protein